MIFGIETRKTTATMNAITMQGIKVLRGHSGLPDRLRQWHIHIMADDGAEIIISGTRDDLGRFAKMICDGIERIDRRTAQAYGPGNIPTSLPRQYTGGTQ